MQATRHPLHSIGKATEPVPADDVPPRVYIDSNINNQRLDTDKNHRLISDSASIPKNLSLAGIKTPAMMLDTELRVVWQNKLAVDQIWHNARTANNGNPTPLIFDLLFDTQFQDIVDNWRHWVSYFISQLIDITPEDILQERIGQMQLNHKGIISALIARQLSDPSKPGMLKGRLRQSLGNGEIRLFSALSIDFAEGRFFAFEPVAIERSSGPPMRSYDIEQRFVRIGRQPNPVKESYSVLCASLHQSELLKIELLSIEYCRMINDLCNRCIEIVERFGGVFGRHSDSGFLAYFLRDDEYGDDNSTNVMNCALALRAEMVECSREWKIRKAWPHEIALNVGIHRENDYIGILTTSLGDSLASYGKALDIAADLSRLAQNGQIWVTKELIDEMLPSARCELNFGIHSLDSHGRQPVLQNSFSRVQDLIERHALSGGINSRIGSMAVTQLFDLKPAD